MKRYSFVVVALLIACAAPRLALAEEGRCVPTPDANKAVVVAFYEQALVALQPRAAFERHAAPDFVEHKPDVEVGTRDATVAYLEELIASVPQPRWELLRTAADGDLVFVHARFSPAPGAPHYAIADIFRLSDCKIVEHWDVVAPPPETRRNPNPRF